MSETNGKSPRSYTRTLKEEEVDIDGEMYKIREMNGEDRDKWLNNWYSRMRTDEKGNILGIQQYQDAQAYLISLCLFDPQSKPVPITEIRKFPGSMQRGLFDQCQEINGGTAKAEEELKKV